MCTHWDFIAAAPELVIIDPKLSSCRSESEEPLDREVDYCRSSPTLSCPTNHSAGHRQQGDQVEVWRLFIGGWCAVLVGRLVAGTEKKLPACAGREGLLSVDREPGKEHFTDDCIL